MTGKPSKYILLRFLQSKFGIFFVIFFVFNAFALYGIFFFFQSSSLESFVAKYPYLDPMRHFTKEQDIITTLQPIRLKFREIVAEKGPQSISIYFEYLSTGANISVNPDLRILPASLIKVPLAMAVMKKIESGDWNLDNQLILMKEDRDTEWGEVYKRAIGSPITIRELIEEMLLNSDNTAYRILYRNLSLDEVQDVLIALGLEEMFNKEGKITVKEYTRLLRSLYTASYLNPDNSQMFLDILSKTPYAEYLEQGITTEDTVFAHKIGENTDEKVISDSGIVYVAGRPYMIAVMIDYDAEGLGRAGALEVMKEISEVSHNYIITVRHGED